MGLFNRLRRWFRPAAAAPAPVQPPAVDEKKISQILWRLCGFEANEAEILEGALGKLSPRDRSAVLAGFGEVLQRRAGRQSPMA